MGQLLFSASLFSIASMSDTYFRWFCTLSSKTGLFKNSSTISSLEFISSFDCNGFKIASLRYLVHIAVFVSSSTQKRVHTLCDFVAKL